jgi:hypothetical protein
MTPSTAAIQNVLRAMRPLGRVVSALKPDHKRLFTPRDVTAALSVSGGE